MDYFNRLIETFDTEDYEEIIIGLFNGKIIVYHDLNQCLGEIEDSDIKYGWFKNADIFISSLIIDFQGSGSINGNGDYYIADDNLNFEFFKTPQNLIDSLIDYDLSKKEINKILRDLK